MNSRQIFDSPGVSGRVGQKGNNVVPGKHGYANIGFPRDKITEGASNELGIHVVICDNSGKNMAFVKEIKDLGIVTVTVDK